MRILFIILLAQFNLSICAFHPCAFASSNATSVANRIGTLPESELIEDYKAFDKYSDKQKRELISNLQSRLKDPSGDARCKYLDALTKLKRKNADEIVRKENKKNPCIAWDEVKNASTEVLQRSLFAKYREQRWAIDVLHTLTDTKLFPSAQEYLDALFARSLFVPQTVNAYSLDEKLVLFEDEAMTKPLVTKPPIILQRENDRDLSRVYTEIEVHAVRDGKLNITYENNTGWIARNAIAFPSTVVADLQGNYVTDLFTTNLFAVESGAVAFGSDNKIAFSYQLRKRYLGVRLKTLPLNGKVSVDSIWWMTKEQVPTFGNATPLVGVLSPEALVNFKKAIGLDKDPFVKTDKGIVRSPYGHTFGLFFNEKQNAVRVDDRILFTRQE